MRTAHKLLLIAVAAIAAMALASPASAQLTTAVEVHNEPTGEHCGHVTVTDHDVTGGCEITAATAGSTTAILAQHVPGMGEASLIACGYSFSGNIEETGHGFLSNQVLTPPGPPCNLVPCREAGGQDVPWPFYIHEFADELSFVMTFCINVGPATRVCTVDLRINEASPHGAYELFTRAPATGSRCSQLPAVSLTGHWVQTGGDEIAIEHEGDL